LRELVDLGLWDDNMKNMIIAHHGSIQNIPNIPDDVKAIYKTVWEISQKKVIDLAADRGAFICQSQSMNIHLQAPTLGQLTSMHFYGWKKGLKTGMYYLRTRPAAQAIQFTVDQSVLKSAKAQNVVAANAKAQNVAAASALQKTTSLPTPSSSPTPSPVATSQAVLDAAPSVFVSAKEGPTLSSSSSVPTPSVFREALAQDLSSDERTRKAAEADPEFAAALQRQKDRELEEAKLMCSLENKEACLMCSG
jgi:ribonucleoside-diphosphate reductase subunit M1